MFNSRKFVFSLNVYNHGRNFQKIILFSTKVQIFILLNIVENISGVDISSFFIKV